MSVEHDIEETSCLRPGRVNKQHCRHWYDGEACCACGDPPMTDEAKAAQGMPVGGGAR